MYVKDDGGNTGTLATAGGMWRCSHFGKQSKENASYLKHRVNHTQSESESEIASDSLQPLWL